ncbi:MAG: lytic transglycosylase domain-containing protein [Nitrososphaera sp.]
MPRTYSIPELQEYADTMATRYGIDPKVFRALVEIESGWNQHAIGDGGASVGLGQIQAATAIDVGIPYEQIRADPLVNLEASAKYLRQVTDQMGGLTADGLRAYNQGVAGAKAGRGYDYAARVGATSDTTTIVDKPPGEWGWMAEAAMWIIAVTAVGVGAFAAARKEL